VSETALARVERGDAYVVGVDDAISPERLLQQVNLIQNVMRSVMVENEHYGVIPGTDKKCPDCANGKKDGAICPRCNGTGRTGKPSLLKPGAEKLCFTFRMDPEFDVEVIDMPRGHREYRVKCTLYSINGGARIGSGVGSASTMESKWRFRTGPKEITDKPVPKEYWDNRQSEPAKAQAAIGGRGFSTAKGEDGKWYIAKQGEKVENENPADVYNTALKIAKKRAMVDAVLTCTAASDIFTQDVEDMAENGVIPGEVVPPKQEAPAASATAVSSAVSPVVPPPSEAGAGDAASAPAPPEEESESSVRDELDDVIEKISALSGIPFANVVQDLTMDKNGKYAKTSTKDIYWEATVRSTGKKFSPLKIALDKAKKMLAAEQAKIPSMQGKEEDQDIAW
jgi:hypothetical protein